jgi:glutaredoxin
MTEGSEISKVLHNLTGHKEFPYFFVNGNYWGTEKEFDEGIQTKRLFSELDKIKAFYCQRTVDG